MRLPHLRQRQFPPQLNLRRQLKQPGAFDNLLQSVRATTVGQSANPVFIDPDSGLRLIATRELIVCLKPGTDPRQFFSPDWNRVRPLASDQFVLTLPDATAEDIFSAVNRHAARSEVEWAEPNFILQMAKSYIPNDPLFVDLWHLQNTGQFGGKSNADAALASAWDVSLGNSNIVIAIMDDGVQLDHPDLALNIFSNPGEIPGNGIDDDNNGFVDDVHGWNFFANNNDPSPAADQDNHGTSLAGVIAGVGNNGVGISGAAPGCRLLPLKMLTGEDGVPVTEVSRVLHYAAGLNLQNQPVWRGADVINISLTFAKSAAVDSAQLQSMARDLASMSQQIDQLKATVAELKAAQSSREGAQARLIEPPPKPKLAPPIRAVAPPVHRPKPAYAQTYSATPVAAAAAPPPLQIAPQATTAEDGAPLVRPPMPLR